MAAAGGTRGVERLLLCRVGAKVCGISLTRVLETMRPLPVEPLTETASFVTGVAVIRGRSTPVVGVRQVDAATPGDPPPLLRDASSPAIAALGTLDSEPLLLLLALRNAGGVTIAQDEESSVVYGMPREAALLGAASRVLPLSEIGRSLAETARARRGIES